MACLLMFRRLPATWAGHRVLAHKLQKRCGTSTRGDFATTALQGVNRFNPAKKRRAFQVDCEKVWGNQYDYSRTKYVDNHTPVSIICITHGRFVLTPREHIQRRKGCPRHLSASTWPVVPVC
eukprot:TRINITY_DN24655_c0_g3_i2.p2 TRINITY_DN24655_c0_g3~~TRINITY_DN24655_c0_g3_i2.p2  ORF type:complete len:122 (+),score=6.40 TRINITY_DN24655_c0_g3_i2:90-455(+)